MTKTDPALEWFQDIVEPTVAEFLSEPNSKRRGCLAALAIASMTEHYFYAQHGEQASKQQLGAFKNAVRNYTDGTGSFAIGFIADLANATKHVNRKNGVAHGDLKATQINLAGVARCGWPLSNEPEILVGENLEWRLVELVECAMTFWREKLDLGRSSAATERRPP